MENIETFESYIANLIRVYDARNEKDLQTVMTAIATLLQYVRQLETRLVDVDDNRTDDVRQVENRVRYLELKI
jgi:hypothetical protein